MKLLITGGNGQVAYDLVRLARAQQIDFIAPSRAELDIADLYSVMTALEQFKPDFVVNTAAYTQVDRAEQEILQSFAVNAEGAKNLAIACEKFHCPLLHLSTDYVFDGKQNYPYIETDHVAPINVYGNSKLLGEEEIHQYGKNFIILRVSAVFGVHGNNFVKTILRLARERETLRIVSDQITCPTPAADIAATLLEICKNPQWGLFHYCGEPVISWYEFAKNIIEQASRYEVLRVKEIEAITTADYPTPAKRPHYSVLNCEKFKKTFHLQQPDWRIGLTNVITTLYAS
jgi:dTDP-4-dehydrorhamnose reductase